MDMTRHTTAHRGAPKTIRPFTLDAKRGPCEIRRMLCGKREGGEGGAGSRLSVCSRHLWTERSLLVVTADLAALLAGKNVYDTRYGISPDTVGDGRALDRLMAAAALAAVSLAERESWGWTLTASGAEHGLFCGVEPEGMVCGTARAADPDRAVAHLQRKKGDGPLVESRFTPSSDDPAATVQRYFLEVEQIQTRVAISDSAEGALVQALPGGALAELAPLGDEELRAELRAVIATDRAQHLDDVVVFYECRCDDVLITKMIAGLPDQARRELWGDLTEICVTCPRCGREFAVSRNGAGPSGASGTPPR
jgi:redox-regulated HSP33 family molecular chaperone